MNNGYQHIVLDRFVTKLRDMRRARSAELAGLKTREDAMAYRAKVRRAVAKAFAPFPSTPCPLNPQQTGVLQCDGYTIEKLRVCTRPEYWMTCNLYLPDAAPRPLPAVVGLCGHSVDGKACPTYQEFAIRLVQNGFAVLMCDPVHQGERYQYSGIDNLGKGDFLCAGHNVMAKQLELVGESMPSWRVWDGRRAVDYLLTRPEIDASRIGVTGNSGGGTLTEWLWANDDRLAFAAPSCHVTTFLTNLENELPTDAEQCPPGILASGLEMVDMMICQAPKPAILLGQKYDFFERRGFLEAAEELRQFYALLDEEANTEHFLGPVTHGYSCHNQKAMVRFFRHAAGMEGDMVDIDPVVHSQEELNVCPQGNVMLVGSLPIYKVLSGMADSLSATRKVPETVPQWQEMLSSLIKLPPAPQQPPHFRVPRPQYIDDTVFARYVVETEGNIRAILRKLMTEPGHEQSLDVEETVHLYLPNFSAEEDFALAPCMKEINPGGPVYALDVRGIGESRPEEPYGEFHQMYGMDYMMHSFSLMFDECYLGRRVFDVLETLRLLHAEGARVIHLHGRAQGAVLAAFTAMLAQDVASVTLYDAPHSYREWIDAGVSDWPVANVPRGVLRHFDLPDLYKALGSRLAIKGYMPPIMP